MNTLAIQETFSNFSNQFRSWWETLLSHLPELLLALVIMCVSYFLSRFAYRMTHRVVSNKVDQKSVGRLISKTVSALIILAGLFMALQVVNLGKSVTGLLAGAGISGLVLGLALQGTLSNTISGIVLSLRKNIRVGDWIETIDYKGEVMNIALNYLVLKESDNNLVIIPNKNILESPLKNYSQTSKMRVVLECGVSYDSDLEKVKEITLNLIRDRFDKRRIPEEPEFYYTEFGSSSVQFLCRFWIHGKSGLDKMKAKSNLIVELKKAFDREGIEIPFPVRTLEFKNHEAPESAFSL